MAKILIIDDDGIVRDALTVFLSRAGHQVHTASDGGNPTDLVILDRDLPVMTGSVVLQKIREISKQTPVIILTGFDAPEDAEAYLRDGAASFLSKGDGLSNVLSEVDRVLGVKKTAAQPIERRRSESRTAGPRKGLLLVADDDQAILNVLSRFLTAEGYEVLLAADGEAAMELARAQKPDIALLDIFMPGKDGLTVLRELTEELPGTGVLMITGNEDEEVAKACLNSGAFDYIQKPISLEVLGNIIKARLLIQKTQD